MVKLQCPIPGCTYETVDGTEGTAIALLAAHTPVHTSAAATYATGPALHWKNGISSKEDGMSS